MNKRNWLKWLIGVLLAIAVGFGLWTYLHPEPKQPDYITATVRRGDIEDSVLASGTLDASKLISVGAQVSGQVKHLYVSLGQQVRQGQPIAQIDSTTQENSFKTAEANIANLTAQRLQQIANRDKVAQELQRQRNMFAQDATSRSELEAAKAAYATATAQVQAIDAQIRSAKVTRDTAATNIGYTKILAPMSGTVVAIVTEEGQTVNANQSAPTIIKLAKLDQMTIKAQISEADVMKVRQGQSVYFTTLGDSNTKRYAMLRQIEPAPESIKTDTSGSSSNSAVYYNALFEVPNSDGQLRIAMTAQVSIVIADAKNALLVPAAALQNSKKTRSSRNPKNSPDQTNHDAQPTQAADNSHNPNPNQSKRANLQLTDQEKSLLAQGKASRGMVRVLQPDGTAQATPVLVGLNNRVDAQILKGLKEGDQVIIADGSDTSNNSAKRSNSSASRMGGGAPMRM